MTTVFRPRRWTTDTPSVQQYLPEYMEPEPPTRVRSRPWLILP